MEGLTISPALILVVVIAFYLITSIKILNEYERGVIFRLGKSATAKGPGVVSFSPERSLVKISLRRCPRRADAGHHSRDNVSVK